MLELHIHAILCRIFCYLLESGELTRTDDLSALLGAGSFSFSDTRASARLSYFVYTVCSVFHSAVFTSCHKVMTRSFVKLPKVAKSIKMAWDAL